MPITHEFNVVQFFEDETSEYVRRNVTAKDAFDAFTHYTHSVGAQMGMVKRVIITDGLDCTNMEWQHGKGITYPTREMLSKGVNL